jgi:hypothetical protein
MRQVGVYERFFQQPGIRNRRNKRNAGIAKPWYGRGKSGGVARGGPLRCEASPKALALVDLALRSPGFPCYNGRVLLLQIKFHTSGRI